MTHVLNPHKRSESGFTLIEMLVAMVIFSSLIAVLMMGFRQGLLMWEKGQGHAQVWQDHEFRYRLLDSLITETVLSDHQTNAGYALPWFDGNPTSVRFVSAAPMMDLQGHPRPVELQAIASDPSASKTSWSLRYREAGRYSDGGRGLRWSEDWVTLYAGLQSFSFSFEAPVYPYPLVDRSMMTKEMHLRYRDKSEWMSHYDIAKLWVLPQTITMDFVDKQGIEHHWLFKLPNWPAAWGLGTYAGGL